MDDNKSITIQKKSDLVQTIEKNDINDIIKPLTKEIHLFDTYIAGTSYIDDQGVFDQLKKDEKLILRREQQNRYDEKAIIVLTNDRVKLGYVPEKDNLIFSRLLDAGKMLIARVQEIKKRGSYTQVNIGIYLVDF